MTFDATQVRVGVTGHLYKAPLGTTLPTTVTASPNASFVELGYTESGPKTSVDTSKEAFTPWQSLFPAREVITGQIIKSKFTLWQRNSETLKLAFGGGTVTGTTTRVFTPPATPTVNEGAFIMEVIDGAITDRYVIARASFALAGDVDVAKDGVTGYEIEMTWLQPASGNAWQLLSSDTAMTADV